MDPSLHPSSFPPLSNSPPPTLTGVSSALPWDRVFAIPPASEEFTVSTIQTPDEPIDFPTADIADAVEELNLSLVGYSLGKRPFYESLLNAAKKLWALKGNIKLISLSDGFFLFKFSCREDFEMVWNKGAWFIFGKPFIFRKWTSHFSPKREEFTTVPIWFKIHDLPLCCWTPVGISKIATKIGAPVAVDSLTASKSRLTYARVCVLVDSTATYPVSVPITVEGKLFNLVIQYEWRPSICDLCKSFNHSSDICPSNPNPTVILPPKPPRGRSSSRRPRPPSKNPSGILPIPSSHTSPSPGKPTSESPTDIHISESLVDIQATENIPTPNPTSENIITSKSTIPSQNPITNSSNPFPSTSATNQIAIPNLNSPNIPSSSSSDQPPEPPSSSKPSYKPSSKPSSPSTKSSNHQHIDQLPQKSSSPNKFNLLNLLSDSEATSNNTLEECLKDNNLMDSASSSPPPNKKITSSNIKISDQPHKNTRGKGSKKCPKSNSKS
ncbi:hypothetical protein KFK09_024833 [Dendrobium nobile]|uniref:DUF4283 domain-containing protein n=1 Tax=Dendrobium nobile TaxID=94219 RepID=A0A8T3AEU7_DENNO|nr:hypothetical protein KFK09_024833 [Dendrobium nobile]